MSGLAALLAGHTRPDVYLWHNAAHVEDVAHAVEKAGWRFVYLDGWTTEDRATFLKSVSAAFELPDTDGDFQGLTDGLQTVEAGDDHGIVLLWDGWSPLARADEASFTSALESFRSRVSDDGAGKLAVLLRGEGPEIEIPDLPDGPH